MNKCPVCGKENTGFVCSDCGFDLSCDFERLPTLSMVKSGSFSCSKLKTIREAKFKNVKRCEVCVNCPKLCGQYKKAPQKGRI